MPQRTLLEAENPHIYSEELRLAIGGTVVGRTVTTDATQTTLLTLPVSPSRTYFFSVDVLARRESGSAGTADDGAAYRRAATYKTVSGTLTLIGSVAALFTAEDQAGWDCTLDIDSNTVRVRVTGAANNTITWLAKATIVTT